ncbi:short transient receptor potential channel 2-like [Arapaima gigas]
MAPIKIKHIVSFTSQDPKYCVKNLFLEGETPRPWLCSPQDHSGVLKVDLQLEHSATIGYIDVGNCGSAFVQIDVGCSSWSLEEPYVTLLPTATFMTPADSRQGTGRTGVRMFKKADFMSTAAESAWDRMRITCAQPFNRRTQFGLSFLRIRSPQDEREGGAEDPDQPAVAQKTPEQMTLKVKEWLSSPAIQQTFFGQRSGESPPQTGPEAVLLARVCRATAGLSRSVHMVTTANSSRHSSPPTPVIHKNQTKDADQGSSTDEEACVSHNAGEKDPGKHLKRKPNASRLTCADSAISSKKAKPLASRLSRPNCSSPSRTHPCSQSRHLDSGIPETTCPICGGYFASEYLPLHASSCQGEVEWPASVETDFTPPHSPSSVSHPRPPHSPTDDLVPCPLCSYRFPLSSVQQHASSLQSVQNPVDNFNHNSICLMIQLLLYIVVKQTFKSVRIIFPWQPDQWREIINKKMRFPPELIGAIQEGNTALVADLLKTGDGIIRQLDDSEDRLWREALNLAIRLGSEDTMDAVLQGVKFDFRQIHEALLVAVDTNQPRVVKKLLDRLDKEKGVGNNKVDVRSFSLAIFDHSIDDSQFAPGVTPLTLACQKDLYEIVTMLTNKGHVIPRPHRISCVCLECRNARQYDLLKFSLSRINTYRGVASRAYLSITSEDAMLSAFRLSRELHKLSKKEPEFKPQYLCLVELCQEFAVELLGMCRNQSEVTTILNNCDNDTEDEDDGLDGRVFEEGIPNLARLRLAVNYNQKQFVAHPICQQVLSSIWCGNLSGWKGSRTAWKLLVSIGIFITMPFLCLTYWVAPKSKMGKMLKIPVIKFLLHSATYLWFLIMLLAESIAMEMFRTEFASRHQNLLHNSLHMVWVAGFFWFECKEVWIEGLRSYFLDWWNCLDMMVLSMYLASFVLRMLILFKGYFACQVPERADECTYFTQAGREEWRPEDPQLIAELLFAVTSLLSFTRLAYILPAQESLGTMQISIGKMIDDMMRFMFILMIIGTAFLCGINNIYVPYVVSPHLGQFNETFRFLFWTLFGVVSQDYVDMPDFAVAEFVGRVLYGIFTLLIVIVLLNMLIAMITNSFQKIEDDADVEWKFARSKLYLNYFREGLTMPVPFNIIPSPKAVFYLIRGIFRRICCCCSCNSAPDYPPITSISNGTQNSEENWVPYKQQVIRVLVQRYIESARREFEESKRKDLGNRITELNKAVQRLHSEMRQIHQTLLHGSQGGSDSSSPEGSSILGKYILGAKNNFRGFSSSSHSPLKVTVREEEVAEAEKDANEAAETKAKEQNLAGGSENQAGSPTDSKDSWDPGFGSQEGEESSEGGADTQMAENSTE